MGHQLAFIIAMVACACAGARAEAPAGELWATSADGLARVYREPDAYGVGVNVVNDRDARVKVRVSFRMWFGDRTDPVLRQGTLDVGPHRRTRERYGSGPGLLTLTRSEGQVSFVDDAAPPTACEVSELELRPVRDATLLLVQFTRGGIRTTINPQSLAQRTDALHKADAAHAASVVEIPIRTGPIDFDAPTNPTKINEMPEMPPDTLWSWTDSKGAAHYLTQRDVARIACEDTPIPQGRFEATFGAARKALFDQMRKIADEQCKKEPGSDACTRARVKADSMGGGRG